MINVSAVDKTTFDVTVEAGTTTSHRVTLTADDHQQLTGGNATPEALIERSFEFLLAREPNTSILRRFDLPLISTYFPEYEKEMRSHFG